MARRCGILKIAPREDDPMGLIRLAPEDVEGETVQGQPLEPGLYHASVEAIEKFRPRVLARLKKAGVIPADMDERAVPPALLM